MIGPQYSGDDNFKARMRFHQSWYRSKILNVPYGTGPNRTNINYYGNMLTKEDGDRGRNFINSQICNAVKSRLTEKKGVVEPFRLYHNMLSSQPMCFNLFGHLIGNEELATCLMKALLPGEIEQVTQVKFEFAPVPRREYLNDHTAFDAFVTYVNPGGKTGFVGIETKLTEPFSQKPYKSEFYDRWLYHPLAPWPESSLNIVKTNRFNQLWRNHLLSFAMKVIPNSAYYTGWSVLVYHPEDERCKRIVNEYMMLLKPEDNSFLAISLDQLIKLWGELVNTEAERDWINKFSLRYLELEASDAEYIAYKETFNR
jgi:hypothetical protein